MMKIGKMEITFKYNVFIMFSLLAFFFVHLLHTTFRHWNEWGRKNNFVQPWVTLFGWSPHLVG